MCFAYHKRIRKGRYICPWLRQADIWKHEDRQWDRHATRHRQTNRQRNRQTKGPSNLEHEHGQLLVVLPLLHGRVYLGRIGREGGATALAGRLAVELGHLLQLLPQVLSDDLSPFCSADRKNTVRVQFIPVAYAPVNAAWLSRILEM